jgi:alpha-mannosidase
MAEDGQGMIIRLYETEGKSTVSTATFFKKVTKAYLVDLNEKPMENGNVTVDGNKISVKIEPYSICVVCVEF